MSFVRRARTRAFSRLVSPISFIPSQIHFSAGRPRESRPHAALSGRPSIRWSRSVHEERRAPSYPAPPRPFSRPFTSHGFLQRYFSTFFSLRPLHSFSSIHSLSSVLYRFVTSPSRLSRRRENQKSRPCLELRASIIDAIK